MAFFGIIGILGNEKKFEVLFATSLLLFQLLKLLTGHLKQLLLLFLFQESFRASDLLRDHLVPSEFFDNLLQFCMGLRGLTILFRNRDQLRISQLE